jgi:hypothetical protein
MNMKLAARVSARVADRRGPDEKCGLAGGGGNRQANAARQFMNWDFEMADVFMTTNNARKFVAAARKLRDGLDAYESRMCGLGAASNSLAADCETLASAAPEALAGREMLDALRVIFIGLDNTMRDDAAIIRGASDEFSKIIRATELEIRKGGSQ